MNRYCSSPEQSPAFFEPSIQQVDVERSLRNRTSSTPLRRRFDKETGSPTNSQQIGKSAMTKRQNAVAASANAKPSANTRQRAAKNQPEEKNSNQTAQPKATGAAKRKTPRKARVLKEIKTYQCSAAPLIPKLPFSRVVREIMQKVSLQADLKITPDALSALLESSSCYLTQMFDDAYRITLNRNRMTLKPEDLQILFYLRGVNDPGSQLRYH